ncbi:N6-adenosine-methyltransferase non-catalytic subunit MTB-like [Rutidosis leptorrhynchoides]|uniref:N6-adenosine-methyltransferase non-catalytic subunit MTB-like n=1 Tax=Rutidosis leptorrhynchoides TaxID=125765 RepID=UPI003A998CB3
MGSPERVKLSAKRDVEDSLGSRSDRARDDETWEADERRKRRSGRSRHSGSGDDGDGSENNGRREKYESRKRSSKAISEEDDYELKKDSRARHLKRKQEESALDSLSTWYQDGEGENRHDVRKSGSKMSDRESSQSKSKVKDERFHDEDLEKVQEKDSRYYERNEVNREKGSDSGRHARKRWDDAHMVEKDERRYESEKAKSKENVEEDSVNLEDVKLDIVDEDEGGASIRERGKRDIYRSTRSRTPERSERRYHEGENNDLDSDKSGSYKRKDEKDGYREGRLKGRDDNWKRRQPGYSDNKEVKDGDAPYDYRRDWETPSQRRGRDRVDSERYMGRTGGRKDNAVKTSSNYGISKDNYDVIEIETKPLMKNEFNEQSDVKPVQNDDQSVEDSKDKYGDDRNMDDTEGGKGKGQRGNLPNRPGGWQGQSTGSDSHGYNDPGSFNRGVSQGYKGNNRMGRGRVRPTGRDGQQVNMQVPMMGSPFGPLGMQPPAGLQPLTPTMSPGPGPPVSPAVFIPPFSPPVVWPGVPPGLPSGPPGGPTGPRFPPNIGPPPNSGMFFNQPGPIRGMPPNMPGPGFNTLGPMGRGQQQDNNKPGGWVPSRNNGPPGKAPSRGEQNDYSQNFVDTGLRPQNYIRELELTSVVEDYPKLRELIQKKDEIVANSATAPMYYKCDLREQVLSPEFFGTKFDVILVDPPWEEYVHRAPGVTDHMEYWSFEEIMNLKIEAIADTPSFVFLWVGDGVGLEQGRQCLKKWGFRRCEDICWVKTNKTKSTPGSRHDSHTLFQRSKEHCLMGIKGTVRRSTDGHIIHANIDTDVIIAEEPPYGSTAKPEDMYRIIEHFSLGRRRLELFGEDHNIRSGWLTVGKDLSSSNFNSEGYVRNFADKDGKVWQGGGGRNPPPEAGHLVLTTPDIESLRPKSPMKNQLQMQQQQSNTISLTGGGSNNKRPTGNSPSSHNGPPGMNQEPSGSNISGPVPWGPMGGGMGPDERFFDNMYGGYNGPFGPMGGDYMDYETHRAMNNML